MIKADQMNQVGKVIIGIIISFFVVVILISSCVSSLVNGTRENRVATANKVVEQEEIEKPVLTKEEKEKEKAAKKKKKAKEKKAAKKEAKEIAEREALDKKKQESSYIYLARQEPNLFLITDDMLVESGWLVLFAVTVFRNNTKKNNKPIVRV